MSTRQTRSSASRNTPDWSRCRIPAEALSHPCDPSSLSFSSTDELPALQDVIGQPRALRALDLGIEVSGIGFNLFVIGIPDSGRTTLTRNYLLKKAKTSPTPDDWCYINNFENSNQPNVLRLPAGMGLTFRREMQEMIAACSQNIPRTFASEEYTNEHERLMTELKNQLENELHQFEEYVSRYNFVIVKTPYGLFLLPAVKGKPITPEELEKLSDENKEKYRQLQEKLSEEMEKTLGRMHALEQAKTAELQELDRRTSLFIIQPLVEGLITKYSQFPSILNYLKLVQADLVQNAARFRATNQEERYPLASREWSSRYEVNLLVNNAGLEGTPVIIENQPTYHNLLGSVEHEIFMGASYTDFTHIRPGALHRANGGYLILPVRSVLLYPYAWEGLKRVLRDGEIRLLDLGNQMGLTSTATLDPEPIPLNVKVILVGTPALYYLLRAYDEDFAKLFKVRAEFARDMERNPDSEQDYALFVRSVVDENHLCPFDRTAVARIIEHSSRMVEDQDKLSTQFGIIADLICEAAYWARREGQAVAGAAAVQKAIDERIYRSNMIEERVQEMIQDGQLLVDVSGSLVGTINALAVSSLGDYMFGRPNRVTATVCAGQAGVVDIERQAELGGHLHTKGVLIISGYLGERYGQDHPLSLSASLTFEQSYDEIEGDSASAAELAALLSALSGIPINQNIAITGSINQHGDIQPIGGVNEKIEGFFETCRQRGLTSGQGVIIPRSNQDNLMLKQEVRDAVAAGSFHIWQVDTIARVVELLTGVRMAERLPDGGFPTDTLDYAVQSRLSKYARAVKSARWAREKSGPEK